MFFQKFILKKNSICGEIFLKLFLTILSLEYLKENYMKTTVT